MEVVVYLLTNAYNRHKLSAVSDLFDQDLYTVIAVEEDQTVSETTTNANETEQDLRKYMVCLNEAKRVCPNKAVLILRDDISSHVDASHMSKIIQTILQFDNWDLCYFFKYQDRCEEWKTKVNLADSDTTIVETIGAKGDLALLFSPYGRDVLLGAKPFANVAQDSTLSYRTWTDFVQSKKNDATNNVNAEFSDLLTEASALGLLRCTAIVPNFFTYEEAALQKHKLSNLLLQECAAPKTSSTAAVRTGDPATTPTALLGGSSATQPSGLTSAAPSTTNAPTSDGTDGTTTSTSFVTSFSTTGQSFSSVGVDTPILHEFVRNANTNLTPRVNILPEKTMSVQPATSPNEKKELTPFVPSSRLLASKKSLIRIGLVFLVVLVVLSVSFVAYRKREWIRTKLWSSGATLVAPAAGAAASSPAVATAAADLVGNRSGGASRNNNKSRSRNSVSVESHSRAPARAQGASRGLPASSGTSNTAAASSSRTTRANASNATGSATNAASYRKNESSLSDALPPLSASARKRPTSTVASESLRSVEARRS